MIDFNPNKNLGCHSAVGVAPVNGNFYSWSYQVCEFRNLCHSFSNIYSYAKFTVKPSNRKPIPKRESSAAASVFPERGQVQHRNGVVVLYGAGALCARATVRRQRSGARVLAFDALHQ